MVVLAWIFGLIVAIVVIAILVAFLNRFYRKSTRDIALVRTGFGGQRVVLSGGCLVLPFLHKVEEIGMGTMRVEVKRVADKSLIASGSMSSSSFMCACSRRSMGLPLRPRRSAHAD